MPQNYLELINESSKDRLKKLVHCLSDAEIMLGPKGCIYATGSFGRLEAGPESDIDVFVVIRNQRQGNNPKKPARPLMNLTDQIILKSKLIEVVRANNIKDFDGGGRFLETHSFESYTEYLGSPEDDFRNTLTGRMLLLLESQCLIGHDAYKKLIRSVVDKYFKDFPGNEGAFLPAFLFNDIIRMWRTFCVNYEFYRREDDPDFKKNLKLKFCRMITCFSAILFLMQKYAENSTVTPADVLEMVGKTPVQRLDFIGGRLGDENELAVSYLNAALNDYSEFMRILHGARGDPDEILDRQAAHWRSVSHAFGENLARVMSAIAGNDPLANSLYRVVLI